MNDLRMKDKFEHWKQSLFKVLKYNLKQSMNDWMLTIPAELSVLDAMLAALRCDEMNPTEVTDPTPVEDVTSDDITSDDLWSGWFASADASFSTTLDLSDIEPSCAIIERPPEMKKRLKLLALNINSYLYIFNIDQSQFEREQ